MLLAAHTQSTGLDNSSVPHPREWTERTTRIERWTEIDRGGHFQDWEEPDLVADDISALFRDLR